ncbi:hypothetical protein FQR65_LT14533 [Abscondita terminalis]|nr:hypothetical protein FQR65_LT14533 [Abscondita terminalis]
MAQVRIKIVHKNFSEAKRSVIDANDFRNFEALKEKIQKIFPTLCESNFKIFWKDNDGDQITIADDDDLSIAFDEMNSETKVFYVENDSGCPFADSSNLNSLRGMAQQYLEPWRTTLGTENAQKFVEMLRNASDGIFGTGNAPPRLTESEVQTEQSSAKKGKLIFSSQ